MLITHALSLQEQRHLQRFIAPDHIDLFNVQALAGRPLVPGVEVVVSMPCCMQWIIQRDTFLRMSHETLDRLHHKVREGISRTRISAESAINIQIVLFGCVMTCLICKTLDCCQRGGSTSCTSHGLRFMNRPISAVFSFSLRYFHLELMANQVVLVLTAQR